MRIVALAALLVSCPVSDNDADDDEDASKPDTLWECETTIHCDGEVADVTSNKRCGEPGDESLRQCPTQEICHPDSDYACTKACVLLANECSVTKKSYGCFTRFHCPGEDVVDENEQTEIVCAKPLELLSYMEARETCADYIQAFRAPACSGDGIPECRVSCYPHQEACD